VNGLEGEMTSNRAVCVFCGSAYGTDPKFTDAAKRVGRCLAETDTDLVYGGGSVGLMGAVADAALHAGGKVVGIIPEALDRREIAHRGATELIVVPGMHERKALMAARSDSFLALPGGIGTFEEFFEVLSWAVLGLHAKPIGILNVSGYFDPLLKLLDHSVELGFVRAGNLELIRVGTNPEEIVYELLDSPAIRPAGPKWLNPEQV
jgi:uncharacterized protein (TIGR00730 family)